MKTTKLLLIVALMMTTAFSCKKKAYNGENPLLSEWSTPFGVPPFEDIELEHFMPAFEQAIKEHTAQIDSIVKELNSPTFANVVLALDNSGERLTQVSTIFMMLSAAETSDKMQGIEAVITPQLSAHSDDILMNSALFAKVRAVYENRTTSGLDSLQIRLTEKTYKEFVRAGAMLNEADKQALREVNEKISSLCVAFGNNVIADTKGFTLELDSADIVGLPAGQIDAARQAATERDRKGVYVFTLDKPSLLPFITYSTRRDLRKKLYQGYLKRGDNNNQADNKQIVAQIVELRLKKANLLGFATYADFGLDDVMAKTPANVYSLLDDVWKPALALAQKELADMKAIKLSETGAEEFESWDWWFYAEKVRKANYDLDQHVISEYFPLSGVQAGIFNLCNRLYGITFRPIVAPVYNKECSVYEVLDIDNTHLGVMYLDFHPRAGKRGGAWCGEFRRASYGADGKKIAPVVSLVCNFTRPTASKPALLTIDEVETFFHEFGHALHFLFTDVKQKGLYDVERDFVELPSQIMENWAFEPAMLRQYAMHHQSGAVISDALIEKIVKAKYFNQGFATVEYLAAAYIDLDLHNISQAKSLDVNAFELANLIAKRGLIPQIEPRYHSTYFNHIFSASDGYQAGYYSYMWAEQLDKDAFEAFVESGDILDQRVARRFRAQVLSKGGTADGMVLYRNFRGADPSRIPLMVGRGLMEKPVVVSDSILVSPVP